MNDDIQDLLKQLCDLPKDDLTNLLFGLISNDLFAKNYCENFFLEKAKHSLISQVKIQGLVECNNLVTKKSSSKEKIKLFMSLFVGRKDIFALRWSNPKLGKSGYSPVCANKWHPEKCNMKKAKCSVCPNNVPVSLNERFVFNHLLGRDESCADVIGIYPLIPDNYCRFLALDFDSHTETDSEKWKADILFVGNMCKEMGVPAYIEISRSGKGAHLWIFFLENVKASKARILGTIILKKSILENHSVSFKSFDRMFPNQDKIPSGGYGNLIALPLQGMAVKQGHSVFVDRNLIPYPDQWLFLSSVKSLKENDIDSVIEKYNVKLKEFITEEVEEKMVDDSILAISDTKSHSKILDCITVKVLDIVKITLSNYVEIDKKNVPEKLLSLFKRTAVFLNPEYFKSLKSRLSVYGIPRYIDCSFESDKRLLLPRGNFEKIVEYLKKADIRFVVRDERCLGANINVVFSGNLLKQQKDALSSMAKYDIGILCAKTGFGKTVTAAAVVAERKTNTLILVPTHALLEQWRKTIKKFLNVDAGVIAGGKDRSTGIIDVAIFNSLVLKNSIEVKPRKYQYGMIIVDECHHVSAFSVENLIRSFKSRYVYGLTATAIRCDGHQKIIFMQCGQIVYSTDENVNCILSFHKYLIPRFTSSYVVERENEHKSINAYYEAIVQDEHRTNLIINDVIKAVSLGESPLVLSDRVEHLQNLYKKLQNSADNVILITGKGTRKQKSELLYKIQSIPKTESVIILATGKYVGEGFDYPRLDSLFLAMPFSWKGTLIQYCGRIQRETDDKKEVCVYDYIDINIPAFDRMYQKRLRGYKNLGYELKQNIADDKLEYKYSEIYSIETYEKVFLRDVSNSIKTITISAPAIAFNKLRNLMNIIGQLVSDGVIVTFIISDLKMDEYNSAEKMRLLKQLGVKVILKDNVTQKAAILDQKIVWYGNINFIGNSDKDDCSLRVYSDDVAEVVELNLIRHI